MVCDLASLPNPENTDLLMMLEDSFAIFVCVDGYAFLTDSEGIVWCDIATGNWTIFDSSCVRMTTTQQTEVTSEYVSMVAPTDQSPNDVMTTEAAEEESSTTATTTTGTTPPEPTTQATEVSTTSVELRAPSTAESAAEITTEENDGDWATPTTAELHWSSAPPDHTTQYLQLQTTQGQGDGTPRRETASEDWSYVTTAAGNTTVTAEGASPFFGANLSYFLAGGIAGLFLLILIISLLLAFRNKSRGSAPARKNERLGQPDDQNDDASSYNNTFLSDNTFRDPVPFGTPEIVPTPAVNGAFNSPATPRRRYEPSEVIPEYVTVIKIHQRGRDYIYSNPSSRPGSLPGYNPSDDQKRVKSQTNGSKPPSMLAFENESLYDSILSARMDIPKSAGRAPGYIGHATMADLSSGNTSLGKAWQAARQERQQHHHQQQQTQ